MPFPCVQACGSLHLRVHVPTRTMCWQTCYFSVVCVRTFHGRVQCHTPVSRTKRMCGCATQDFPTLLLKLQQYTHTNGNTVPLLMAEGTLPMYYQVLLPLRTWSQPLACPPAHSTC